MSYTAQQGAGATLYAGNTTISGAQWTDNVWQITQPTVAIQAHQSGQNTYLYFLCADQGSTTTASNAIGSNIARTYLQPTASIADLTTSLQSTNKYFQITRFRDAEGGDYPPNDGGSQALALYVVLMNYGGTAIAQTTAYRCFSVTLQYQSDQVSARDIAVPGSGIANTVPTSGYYQAWSRTVAGYANDLNIYYLSSSGAASLSQMTSNTGAVARSYTQTATRQWSQLGSNLGYVQTTFAQGYRAVYYIYTRTIGNSSGQDVTDATSIAQNANRIWDGYYYKSNNYYNAFSHTEVDDQVNISGGTSGLGITVAQGQNTSTQLQVEVSGVGQAGGDNTYAFFTSNTSATGQTHGVTTVSPATSSDTFQITLSNANGAFPDQENTNEQFYLWAKHPQDTSQTYFYTGKSTQVFVADSVPNAPMLSPSSYSGVQTSTTYTASWYTLSVTAGTQVQWQVTGQGSPQLSTDGVNWSTSISRELQQIAYVRMTSASTTGTTRTANVRFAQDTTVNSDFTVTTTSASGQASQDGGGAQNYGLKIYKSNGQDVIIDGSSRIGAVIGTTTLSFQDAQTGPSSTGQDAFTSIDCSDENVTAIFTSSQHFDFFYPTVAITRRSSAQQGITVKVPNQLQQYSTTSNPSQVSVTLIRH